MRMFRVGDRVTLFFNMGKTGTIVKIREQKSKTWLAGGPAGHRLVAEIKFDDKSMLSYPVSELMLMDS